MNFSLLIKTLVDYIDLGKRIATTIPGMVLAFGFVLLFAQAPDVLRLDRLKQEIDDEIASIEKLRTDYAALEQKKEEAKVKMDLAGEVLAGYDQQRQTAAAAYKQKPAADTRAALQAAQRDYETAWTGEKKRLDAEFRATDAALSAQKTRVDASKARIDSLEMARADASGFTGGLNSLFNAVILFGLVGFALGVVLDPVNKAVFLNFIPDTGEKRGSVFRSFTGYDLKRAHESEYTKFEVQYYIGRGLITQAEYDDLVASYFRLTEISVGMILPVIVLAAGYIRARHTDDSWPTKAAIMLAAIGLGYFLFHVGIKRYGDFQRRVYQLIEGRDAAFEEQKRQAEREAIAVTQAATIRELKDLIARVKGWSVDTGPDESIPDVHTAGVGAPRAVPEPHRNRRGRR